jgi:hypothetical protein
MTLTQKPRLQLSAGKRLILFGHLYLSAVSILIDSINDRGRLTAEKSD